ncbi:transposase [Candidatus Berkelbacteria bacterium]|nr:transposase [Candidatus Berkelbacteria bacterium]
MVHIRPTFVTDGFYHVYNRGVAKQPLFVNDSDRDHLLKTLSFYLESEPPKRLSIVSDELLLETLSQLVTSPLVEILAYCLMPNHFHLLVKQRSDGGVSTFLRRAQNSYTRYYNTKYYRVGTMFQGRFHAVEVTTDAQLLHVSRYIHLNPVVARLSKKASDYNWSSYPQYVQGQGNRLCNPSMILAMAHSPENYDQFVTDYMDYAISLHDYKDLLLDV